MSKFMYTANGRVISNKQRIIEGMADVVPAQKLPSDFFNLAGNLKLAGSVRATNFYKEDGTELSSVVKMGLPENVYYIDKKLGINQDKPMADLDVKGTARVLGELGVDGSMGISGNFVGKGSSTFGGKVIAEDDLSVMKNGGFGGYLNVGGNLNTQGSSTFKGLVTVEDELVVNKNAGVRGNFGVGGNFGTQGTSTFKGLLTAEDELVVNKNAGVRGNFDAQGLATFKSTVRIDNSTEQDKIMVFQNGDSKPPYLFYNKQGNMGVWNGDKAPWVLEGSGKFASDAGSFYRAGDHSALQVKNGQNEGAYFWINDNNRDADGGKSTATVRNDAGHMRLQSKGGRGLVVQADTGNVVVDEDISATRHLNANGNANISGDIAFTGVNKWIVHTPDDDRRIMYIAPGNDKGEWMWDKQTQFLNNGDVQLSGGLNANNSIKVPATSQICIGDTCVTEAQLKQLATSGQTSSSDKNKYMYLPEDAIIYHNLFEALYSGVIAKSGNPNGWDENSFRYNPWNGRNLLRIGFKNAFPNGLLVNVPEGKNVIWIMVLSDRWESFEVYTPEGKSLGNYTSGFRLSNRITPDVHSSVWHTATHTWMPIPVPGPGQYIICGGNKKNDGGNDCWISGIAFSSNIWNHAMNSAVAYHWLVNDGTTQPTWINQNVNGDQQARLDRGKSYILNVPVVKSNTDKVLYFVLIDEIMNCNITVNDKPLDKLGKMNANNPFVSFYNSKSFNKIVGTKIPNNLVPASGLLAVKVDLTGIGTDINFREIGTFDMP